LRPAGSDDLGVRRAMDGRILPFLVAAMAFLAALSLGGVTGATALARHWRVDAAAVLTVQVPDPDKPTQGDGGTRLAKVLDLLRQTPGVAQARPLSDEEMAELLRPWLGRDAERISLPLPAVIEVRLAEDTQAPADLAPRLAAAVPGTMVEDHGPWLRRLSGLARSLRACAMAVLVLVAAIAAGVIVVATRSGLVMRRTAIEIVHGLGATDGYVAGRFARRITWLTALGAFAGTLAALPVLVALAGVAAPLAGSGNAALAPPYWEPTWNTLPQSLWALLPCLPVAAAVIGWVTAQGTVRLWLRRLP